MALKKRFGQNFLQDAATLHGIALAISPQEKDHFVEIGPGAGALTAEILPNCHQLDAIEIDRDLISPLQAFFGENPAFTLHQADALRFDFSQLIKANQSLRVIGNLPYNISTPLLFHLVKYAEHIKDMHFVLQQEVVQRLAATPNNKHYGRLSVMMQYHCQISALQTIPPEVFNPPPKVTSALVRLIPYQSPPHPANNFERFAQVVHDAFNLRRKTLRNSLKQLLKEKDPSELPIDLNRRAETLSLEEFVTLSNCL